MSWLPAVFGVTVNLCVPYAVAVNVNGSGSTAFGSELVSLTIPVKLGTRCPAASTAVTVAATGFPAVTVAADVTRNSVTGFGVTRTLIVAEPKFDTARSGRPSPLKSHAAPNIGRLPTMYMVGVPNVASPVPGNT